MGQISINLTDIDKQSLKKQAKEQHKSLSEFCRERLFTGSNPIQQSSTNAVDISELDKKLTTLNKNLIVLFNEIKTIQQNQNEIKKQVYYNSSYLYFLTQELLSDNPEIANNIDKKINQINTATKENKAE